MKITVANQKGGVGKTTTALNLAWFMAQRGKRTLLIDTDSQGSIGAALGVKSDRRLSNLLINRYNLAECITPITDTLHIIGSDRETSLAEAVLSNGPVKEMSLKLLMGDQDKDYDAVVVDVAPSITLMQSCAIAYSQNVLIPVSMDLLALNGASSVIDLVTLLNNHYKANISVVGILPVQVDKRLSITTSVLNSLVKIAAVRDIRLLPEIRTDQAVNKAVKARKPLLAIDPTAKAACDYTHAFQTLIELMEAQHAAATTTTG